MADVESVASDDEVAATAAPVVVTQKGGGSPVGRLPSINSLQKSNKIAPSGVSTQVAPKMSATNRYHQFLLQNPSAGFGE